MKPNNTSLRLFTKTWPRKTRLNGGEDILRPLTATLEEPKLLDPRLMGEIDMSLIRKEFLAITSLCRINRRAPAGEHRRPVKSENNINNKTTAVAVRKKRKSKRNAENNNDNNNRINNSDDIGNAKLLSIKQLPAPCTTCGRPDQPERFHSHPTTPLKPLKPPQPAALALLTPKIPIKNSVQKPVAIRYQSTSNMQQTKPILSEVKSPAAAAVAVAVAPRPAAASSAGTVRSSRGPRTLTCYICGREFGTASLPLHEPRCLEKWDRENQNLPPKLRKKRPEKPDVPMTKEEWNKFAWESAQAQLTPCENCNRTFHPDRLEVHQRSCKEPQRGPMKWSGDQGQQRCNRTILPGLVACAHCGKMFGSKSIKIHEPQCYRKLQKEKEISTMGAEERVSTPNRKPAMVPCYLCGRLFGVQSLDIHEPQCLKKWCIENDKLPANKRRPIPPKPEIRFTADGKIDFDATEDASWQSHLAQLVACKRCKRTFNPDRVHVHERSCKGIIVAGSS